MFSYLYSIGRYTMVILLPLIDVTSAHISTPTAIAHVRPPLSCLNQPLLCSPFLESCSPPSPNHSLFGHLLLGLYCGHVYEVASRFDTMKNLGRNRTWWTSKSDSGVANEGERGGLGSRRTCHIGLYSGLVSLLAH